ncbi:hypothetical protein Slin15195_G112330 [Septoria linicola]|uniref:Uncharacterized protein n=1 Tax=Septoria linicola TaxID=215465 RepID=A0A9Q9EPP7_9PEZI|nr:hypothetical protein Slin15195_G112330 [Septoria linicola]
MASTKPTKLRFVVQIRNADDLKFDVTSETMMFEVMDLIEEAIGVKPYRQCLRLGFPGVVVVDGAEDNDDLARTLGELNTQGTRIWLRLQIKPKQNLERCGSGPAEVSESSESEESVDPSDVEIVVERKVLPEPKKMNRPSRREKRA